MAQGSNGVAIWMSSEMLATDKSCDHREHQQGPFEGASSTESIAPVERIAWTTPLPLLQTKRIASTPDSLDQNSLRLTLESSGLNVSVEPSQNTVIEPTLAAEKGAPADETQSRRVKQVPVPRTEEDDMAHLQHGLHDPGAGSLGQHEGVEPIKRSRTIQPAEELGLAHCNTESPWAVCPFDRPRTASSLPELGGARLMVPPRLSHPPAWNASGHDIERPYVSVLSGFDGSSEFHRAGNDTEAGRWLSTGLASDRALIVAIPRHRVTAVSEGDDRAVIVDQYDQQQEDDGTTISREDGQMSVNSTRIAPSWSKFPSRTRHMRSSSAGPTDNVVMRGFATKLGPRARSAKSSSWQAVPGPTGRVNLRERSVSIGKTLLYHIGRLYRSESTGYRLWGSGRRSSIATGGGLEHPELEVIRPRSPPLLLGGGGGGGGGGDRTTRRRWSSTTSQSVRDDLGLLVRRGTRRSKKTRHCLSGARRDPEKKRVESTLMGMIFLFLKCSLGLPLFRVRMFRTYRVPPLIWRFSVPVQSRTLRMEPLFLFRAPPF